MPESLNQSWIQVIGTIAIHDSDHAPVVLTGSTRTMLAMLIAGGRHGASMEAVAMSHWGHGERPTAWAAALRLSLAHLQNQLPPKWQIVTTWPHARLEPGPGWVDAWRVAEGDQLDQRPHWLNEGLLFDGIAGIPLVDEAITRLAPLMPSSQQRTPAPVADTSVRNVDDLLANARRAVILGNASTTASLSLRATKTNPAMRQVVGDTGLLLPLGPYIVEFPELRSAAAVEQAQITPDAIYQAVDVVTGVLTDPDAATTPLLIVSDAHHLDAASLAFTSVLLERTPVNDLSIILLADADYRDSRWLDFVNGAGTAGCQITTLEAHGVFYDSVSAT